MGGKRSCRRWDTYPSSPTEGRESYTEGYTEIGVLWGFPKWGEERRKGGCTGVQFPTKVGKERRQNPAALAQVFAWASKEKKLKELRRSVHVLTAEKRWI